MGFRRKNLSGYIFVGAIVLTCAWPKGFGYIFAALLLAAVAGLVAHHVHMRRLKHTDPAQFNAIVAEAHAYFAERRAAGRGNFLRFLLAAGMFSSPSARRAGISRSSLPAG